MAPTRVARRTAVVVGTSLAGINAAQAVRTAGFDGRVVLVGAEPHLPYDKPPLSKSVLTGTVAIDATVLRGVDALDALGIELRLQTPATGLDPATRTIELDGSRSHYDALVVATGSHARHLPNAAQLGNVHVLRTWDDAIALNAGLAGSPRVVVIGGGFIGGEVAASARCLGLDVTIVEAATWPMARVLGGELARDYVALHEAHGVRVLRGAGVHTLVGHGVVEEVVLTNGRSVPADLVVVGIGTEPATGWLAGSGLEISDGIACDATLCAGPDGVYAAGDVAHYASAAMGEMLRTAHWADAIEQGRTAGANAAATLTGAATTDYLGIPTFWSMLYGYRIQVAGVPARADRPPLLFRLGEKAGPTCAIAVFVDTGEIVGICAVNAARPFRQLSTWFAERRRRSRPTLLTDLPSDILPVPA